MTLRFTSGPTPFSLIGGSLLMCAALWGCGTPDHGTDEDPVTRDDSEQDAGRDDGTDGTGTGDPEQQGDAGYITGAPLGQLRLGESPRYPMDDGEGGDDVEADDEGGDDAEGDDEDGSGNGAEGAPPPASDPAVEDDDALEPPDSEAQRLIARATILAWAGDVLFSLTPDDGLAALDLSDPSALRVLDTAPFAALPAEMIQVNDSLLVIERDQTTKPDGQGGELVAPTVSLETFDVKDPTQLSLSASSTVPGVFIASRRVGDVLYLVTSDDCDYAVSEGRVLVTSFDLTEAPSLAKIDQLALSTGEYSVCDGPVAVSAQRLYIGRTYGGEGDPRSQLRVVDISDPGGELVEGATLAVEGSVNQFDEYEGVLRLFAQHLDSEGLAASRLSTFSFTDAGEAVLEGELPIEVAEPQWLDVTFDGPRAFVPYYEDSETLLTFDLSDPASPEQAGQLDDLSNVVSLEPRGDRLYVLGLGSESNQILTVLQAIDVSDLNAPTLLSEVQFAGTPEGSNQPELAMLLDEGLIVAWDTLGQSEHPDCSYAPASIQLVEVEGDTLKLGGSVSAKGYLGRAMFHSQRLITLSGHGVETFDVSDRQDPQSLDQYAFGRRITKVVPLGDALLRLGSEGDVDATSVERASERQGTAELPLATVDQVCTWGSWGEARTFGDVVYLPRFGDENHLSLSIMVVDVTDAEQPELVTELNPELPVIEGAGGDDQYFSNVHLTSNALLVERVRFVDDVDVGQHTSISYEVFTLDDPLHPTSVATIDVPDAIANAGWGVGGEFRSSSVPVSGDVLFGTHFVPLASDPLRGRYYLDRLDVSTPKRPQFLPPINVPGSVVHYDEVNGRLITSAIDWTELETDDEQEGGSCWDKWVAHDPAAAEWTDGQGQRRCVRGARSLHQLSVQKENAKLGRSIAAADEEWAFADVAELDGVILLQQFTWEFSADDAFYRSVDSRILALDLELETQSITALQWDGSVSRGNSEGRRWVTHDRNQVFVFDASDPTEPTTTVLELQNEYCSTFQVDGGRSYCGTDYGSVEVLEMD